MGSRLDLQILLETITAHVYFQPPESLKMIYPCIVYERSSDSVKYADNQRYFGKKRYQVTVIDANPDSTIPDLVSLLPECAFERHFTADNLNHDIYYLYF